MILVVSSRKDAFALFGEVDACGKGKGIVCTGSILIDETV